MMHGQRSEYRILVIRLTSARQIGFVSIHSVAENQAGER